MKDHAHIKLTLKSDKGSLSPFFSLLQKGFEIKARAGSSIKNLLCEQFGVGTNYFEDRIQTIFLDGKPVDDAETAIVKDGCTLALSAAVGGLVGSTFRRGSALAAFRSGITYREQDELTRLDRAETVKVKLFNLLVSELGPVFLQKGISVKKQDAVGVLKDMFNMSLYSVEFLEKDGRKISPEQFAALNWSKEQGDVLLSVMN